MSWVDSVQEWKNSKIKPEAHTSRWRFVVLTPLCMRSRKTLCDEPTKNLSASQDFEIISGGIKKGRESWNLDLVVVWRFLFLVVWIFGG